MAQDNTFFYCFMAYILVGIGIAAYLAWTGNLGDRNGPRFRHSPFYLTVFMWPLLIAIDVHEYWKRKTGRK
jgi:hypothetical protein